MCPSSFVAVLLTGLEMRSYPRSFWVIAALLAGLGTRSPVSSFAAFRLARFGMQSYIGTFTAPESMIGMPLGLEITLTG